MKKPNHYHVGKQPHRIVEHFHTTPRSFHEHEGLVGWSTSRKKIERHLKDRKELVATYFSSKKE